jgi:hypothetical protein
MALSLQVETGMKSPRPLAGLSLDLDNLWSYLRTHGDSGWQEHASYFDIFLPRILDLLDELELRITFFIVGQDAALKKNAGPLAMITKRGHEVGNHSYHHSPWLHLHTLEELRYEVLESERFIVDATGQKPVGFRGPGFSLHPDLLGVLADNGYGYDASLLPTFIGPLARLYYFRTSKFQEDESEQRKNLFGRFRDAAMPVKPFFWRLSSGQSFLEIPVTTMPILRVPFHLSYLLYLSRFSEALALFYLRVGLFFCRMTRVEPNLLLHPLDFLDRKEIPQLSFFPAMDISSERKRAIFRRVIEIFRNRYEPVAMNVFSSAVKERAEMRRVDAQ